MEQTTIERWMRKDGRWVLLKNVPALKCDVCGETSFSGDVVERIMQILGAGSAVPPTGARYFVEYDYAAPPAVRRPNTVVTDEIRAEATTTSSELTDYPHVDRVAPPPSPVL